MSLEIDFLNWRAGMVPRHINNFSALVFMLVGTADPVNMEKLRRVYPAHVAMFEQWMNYSEEPKS